MEITNTTQTRIIISAKEIQDIVTNHLKEKGYDVIQYREIIKTVYDGSLGDMGEETFASVDILVKNEVIRTEE